MIHPLRRPLHTTTWSQCSSFLQVSRQKTALPFFDDALLDYMIDNTNKYAEKKIASMRPTKCGLYRNWRPVMKEEMKGFIAVILNMGIIQLGDLK